MPIGVGGIWRLAISNTEQRNIRKIFIGSFYISPRSKYKNNIIEHIIQTIHYTRSLHDNQVNFIVAGDFNRVSISEIISCYGALKQVCLVPSRNNAALEVIITDLGHLFHPPTSFPSLKVDSDKTGRDSDHLVIVFAPKSNSEFYSQLKTRTIKYRPMEETSIIDFGRILTKHTWKEVYATENVNEKVNNFHQTLRTLLDIYFPEKVLLR